MRDEGTGGGERQVCHFSSVLRQKKAIAGCEKAFYRQPEEGLKSGRELKLYVGSQTEFRRRNEFCIRSQTGPSSELTDTSLGISTCIGDLIRGTYTHFFIFTNLSVCINLDLNSRSMFSTQAGDRYQ